MVRGRWPLKSFLPLWVSLDLLHVIRDSWTELNWTELGLWTKMRFFFFNLLYPQILWVLFEFVQGKLGNGALVVFCINAWVIQCHVLSSQRHNLPFSTFCIYLRKSSFEPDWFGITHFNTCITVKNMIYIKNNSSGYLVHLGLKEVLVMVCVVNALSVKWASGKVFCFVFFFFFFLLNAGCSAGTSAKKKKKLFQMLLAQTLQYLPGIPTPRQIGFLTWAGSLVTVRTTYCPSGSLPVTSSLKS